MPVAYNDVITERYTQLCDVPECLESCSSIRRNVVGFVSFRNGAPSIVSPTLEMILNHRVVLTRGCEV